MQKTENNMVRINIKFLDGKYMLERASKIYSFEIIPQQSCGKFEDEYVIEGTRENISRYFSNCAVIKRTKL